MKSASFFPAFGAILLATVSTTCKANDNHDHGHDTDVHAFNVSSQTLTDPYPYYFPVSDAQKEDETPFPMPLCYGTRVEEASIVQLQGYLTDGTLTSAKLLECYLRRIMQVDTFVECVFFCLRFHSVFCAQVISSNGERRVCVAGVYLRHCGTRQIGVRRPAIYSFPGPRVHMQN